MNLYRLKKLLMLPYTRYKRSREKNLTGFFKEAFELHYYRPAIYRYLQAVRAHKDLMYAADLTADSIVLDVGAYTGSWSAEIAKRYNPTILAFEPNPLSFARLEATAARAGKLIPLPYGLGDKTGTFPLFLETVGSSFFSTTKSTGDTGSVEATVKAIDAAWQELDLQTVDLMKINIEGAEFPLLEKMIEADLLKNVDCFLIQFHEWHPGAYRRRRKIRRELARTHALEWDYHFVWEKWRRK